MALTQGDIAIAGYNTTNPDSIRLVVLVDIVAGTTFNITDNGWQSSGSFRTGEGILTYTAPTDISAGTVLTWTNGNGNNNNSPGFNSNNPSNFALNASGDSLIIYTGTLASPTLIYALNSGNWSSNATSAATSAEPTAANGGTLETGITTVAITTNGANGYYSGSTSGTQAELLAAISTGANWTASSTITDIANWASSFTLSQPLPNIEITEYMYAGANGEFVEFTNLGTTAVDFTGWSFDDSGRTPGTVDLSAFGIVQPGESVILTEATEAAFRAAWGLSPSVKVIGELTRNLGRSDEINLYDNNGELIDRLTYGDQAFPGTIRTQAISGWTDPGNLNAVNINPDWIFSTVGDAQNSFASTGGDIGNPGFYNVNITPIPGIVITESGGSIDVTEGGATDTYTIILKTQPTADVTINIAVDDQVTTNSPTLVFTPDNWNLAQTVTVIAVDDNLVEGTHTGTITHNVSSDDTNYNGIGIANIIATITDNDAPANTNVNIQITEYMYAGGNGEFVEFTNLGTTAVDFTGWSFSDDARTAGLFNLSGFGIVQPGESVILTETTAEAFRASWNLSDSVKIIGNSSPGLGRADEINLYDNNDQLIDRLTYGDQTFPGTIRTQGISGWTTLENLAPFEINTDWQLSAINDNQNSYQSIDGAIGNPGIYIPNPVDTAGAPRIEINPSTTDFLDGENLAVPLAITGAGAISGVINYPTDPAKTLGIDFTLSDPDTPIGDLTVTVTSNNQAVVPDANLTLSGTGAERNLKIDPTGVGLANITVTVSDGTLSNSYIINYAASAGTATPSTSRFLTGASDASTAIAIDANYMFVADDEDQTIRLYDRNNSGLPLASFDFTSMLGLAGSSEVDIEASTRIGDTIYWMGSHSNNSSSQDRPNRERIFATQISGTGVNTTLTFQGYYQFLEDDMIAWDNGNGHGLGAGYLGLASSAAAGILPELPNGFNIEGLTVAPDGTTGYVAFRAPNQPIPDRNQALIVPVTNFTSILDNTGGTSGSATFGAPILLDLGGRGIRSIERNSNNQYLIIAGPAGEATGTAPNDFRLYTWNGNAADAPVLRTADLTALNTGGSFETIVEVPDVLTGITQIQVLIDNGDTVWYENGTISKNLPQDNFQKFRSDIITLGSEFSTIPAGVISLSNPYIQDFDSLISSSNSPWVDTETIPGWYATRPTIVAGTGSSNAGNLYSFGLDTDRALGSVASGGTDTIYFGARFFNDTDTTISALSISYIGEQWRNGGNTTQQKLDFAYQIGATELTSGTWIDVDSLDFLGPIATSTAGAINGNSSENRVSISDTLTDLSLAPGEEIWLRWTDINDPGNDHGLAIDDLEVWVPEMVTLPPGVISLSNPYFQDFDSLINSGNSPWVDTETIPGWYATRPTIVAGTGSSNAGNLYSFGTAGDTDRALGSVASGGTGTIYFGARFFNDTNATINTLGISYIGEQWRNGGNTTQHQLDFAYQIGANDLTSGTWVDVDSLDFLGPIATSSAGAINGNASANQVSISDTLTGLSLAPGEEIWLRWTDIDNPGADHGLAIDNLQVSTTALPGVTLIESDGSTNVTEGGETDTYTLVLNTQPSADVTVTINTDSQSTTTPNTLIFTPANWNTPQTVTVIAVDDDVLEGTHFSNISHLAISSDSSYNGINIPSIIATITDNDVVTEITKIHEIQGNGAIANFLGEFRAIEGIVVGDFQAVGDTQNLRGFYVQEEDADADDDPLTSEGIFVFDDDFGVNVKVGDKVKITGQVSEFTSPVNSLSLSQLRNLTEVTILSENNPLPTATVLTFPLVDINQLEAVEGMRVVIPQVMTVTEHFQLGRFGQVLLSSDGPSNQPGTDGRLEQYTQFNAPSISGNAAYQEEIALRRIFLDDGQGIQNPDPIIHGRGGEPLSAENTLRGGDTVFGLSGIMDARFGDYRIQPVDPADFIPTNPRPETVPDVGGTLKVASFNVLNYFNGDGLGGGFPTARGADNLFEFNRQRDKIIQAILGMDADVLGLIEIENDGYGANSAIQDLVNGLNDIAGAGTYAIIDPGLPQLGTDAIAVGFIYKPGSVTPVGIAATVPDGFGQAAFDDNNRKPLAQTFQENSSGEEFTAVVNHFKSKGSSAGGIGDADIGDGQGFSNGNRTRASQDLIAWLATNPTGIDDPDYLIMGDINAYAKEDPMRVLEMAGYQNLVSNSSYSFVFNGQWGSLDHALANESLAPQITGAAKWHINADEPNVLDYNTNFKSPGQVDSLYSPDAFRSSDHDPVIIGLNLNSVPTVPLLNNSGSDIFTIRGNSDTVQLQVTLTRSKPSQVNELGVFTVDDAEGRINGIAPGAAGYAAAALERGQAIFSAVHKLPVSFSRDNITRLLEFNSGDNLRFYAVPNGTTDEVQAGIIPISNVVFADASSQRITNLGNDEFSLAWKVKPLRSNNYQDFEVRIQATEQSLPLGTGLQSGSQSELIDLRGITQSVQAEFVVNRDAVFNNYISFYRVTDENGGIDINGDGTANILPGEPGYTQAAVNARLPGLDLTTNNRRTSTYNAILEPGSILAPFMIADGRPENIDHQPVYFPFLGANPTQVDHITMLGNNVFGFEDLQRGTGKDYSDMILRVNLTVA